MEGSSFKITAEAAQEILEKAPEPVSPQAVDSIGKRLKYNIIEINVNFLFYMELEFSLVFFFTFFLNMYNGTYTALIHFQLTNVTSYTPNCNNYDGN